MTLSRRIEDYGLLGNLNTAALVGRDGSVEWLALPRFDSPACFCALLGEQKNGCWRIAPEGDVRSRQRRYLDETLVLETTFETDEGCVRILDFMPIGGKSSNDLVRIVQGVSGTVPMKFDLRLRFDYGRILPWVRPRDGNLVAIAGPDAIRIDTPLDLHTDTTDVAQKFVIRAGETLPIVLSWYHSYEDAPPRRDAQKLLEETIGFWREWCGRSDPPEPWRDAVMRSLITLKALTYSPSGGIVAAATTGLPEEIGGQRNWDYRFCWLRDATFALYALAKSGHRQEARDWREWLRRAIAGDPSKLQVMYGLAGERRLDELELPWLSGFEGSRPIRIGNAAHRQLQLDVYGEVMDSFLSYRSLSREEEREIWLLERGIVPFVEAHWQDKGHGIWERRNEPKSYVTSRVMCWVAIDRAIKCVERFGFEGPVERWRPLRETIHEDVCRHGYSEELGAFREAYGEENLDASTLLIPLVGFLPPDDLRVVSNVETIRRELTEDGFVRRYDQGESKDGLPGREAHFIACSLWLADNLALMGRDDEAREIFERVLAVRNDLGLLAEQYDPADGCQLGNFPQAFSHVGIINTAHNLSHREGPAEHRSEKHRSEKGRTRTRPKHRNKPGA